MALSKINPDSPLPIYATGQSNGPGSTTPPAIFPRSPLSGGATPIFVPRITQPAPVANPIVGITMTPPPARGGPVTVITGPSGSVVSTGIKQQVIASVIAGAILLFLAKKV